jgi:hypothetical protein
VLLAGGFVVSVAIGARRGCLASIEGGTSWLPPTDGLEIATGLLLAGLGVNLGRPTRVAWAS